jgi:hypothetical protein
MRRNGQAAAELITILGVALVVALLFFMLSATMLQDARVQQNYDDARNSVNALSEAADSVYAQGEGATRKVMITLPVDTVFGSNTTFIDQNGISINVKGSAVFAMTRPSLVGQFPSTAGKYTMRVTSKGALVEIYPYLVDVNKYSVSITMGTTENRSAQITVTRVSGEAVNVTPTWNWLFDNMNLSLAPSVGFLANDRGSAVTVNVNTMGATPGIYNSQITLTAIGATSGTTDTINIPISVNVRT